MLTLKKANNQILNEIHALFKEQPSGESEIEEVVEKIKDERKKSDVKGQVILEELDSEPSSNAPKIMCLFGGISSKHRLKDTEKNQS